MEGNIESASIRHGAGIPDAMREVVAGAAGGIAQVLIGQPFDIVKVRMQTQANGSALRVSRKIWAQEGTLAFYKGSLSPLLGVGACISIVFSSFHGFKQALAPLQSQNPHNALPLPLTYAAGGLAGLTNSVISGPMEHIRIRLQIQSSSSSQRVYTGVRDCVRGILQQAGPAGLYRGQSATMLREFHSYGIWFSVYEVLLSRVMETEGKRRDEIASWKIAGCGALTGEVLWAANYPFDVVKSKMQADGFEAEQRYCNMRDVIRQTWRTHGLHGFFRGLGPTLLRALPVSAGTFTVVEEVRQRL